MKTIDAAKFKEQCLALLEHLTSEGLVITKRGKPVARVLPYARTSTDLIGSLRGELRTGERTLLSSDSWGVAAR